MIFPTVQFLVFFLVVWTLSWLLVQCRLHVAHKCLLLGASWFFYATWSWRFLVVLIASIGFNWAIGLAVARAPDRLWRQIALTAGIAGNLTLLATYKYLQWLLVEINAFLATFGFQAEVPIVQLILPIGISFFTFQGISYIVDVSRGDVSRPASLLDVAMLMSFFPHVLAGPIVRGAQFLPQLASLPSSGQIQVGLGVMLIVWGVFKKAVLANSLAVEIVDKVFFDPSAYGAIDLWLAVYAYAAQIYCDFSGYSDIAIGLAALLGYRFQRNFDQPYRATSISDFWRRWHMSLSTWLRDYLYIPLGGNRSGPLATGRNLMITMLLGGLWHGAAWKFVIWGAYHGGALVAERQLARVMGRWPLLAPGLRRRLAILATFHVVCIGWIIFRADSLQQALNVFAGLGDWRTSPEFATPRIAILIAAGLLIHAASPCALQRFDHILHRMPGWAIGAIAALLVTAINLAGGDNSAPFIYFRF